MLNYPHIDPVIFRLGPLAVRWYGLMYIVGFLAVHMLVGYQTRKYKLTRLAEHYEDLNFFLILSLILGARLGYILFYNLSYYLGHPLEIIAVWQGGLSFHGALLGMLIGGWLFCRKHQLNFLATTDVYVVAIPIGLGLGRLGNFINGELFGRVSEVPWAMVFPAGGPMPRHPSQLYECFLEGILLFTLLWTLRIFHYRRGWPAGTLIATFLVGYGALRILVEQFREPDVQVGFLFNLLTMGQLLSGLMVAAGLLIFFRSRSKPAAV
jgi:phosphatidylglycerol:prolipoprotein diacylglycerol transferase